MNHCNELDATASLEALLNQQQQQQGGESEIMLAKPVNSTANLITSNNQTTFSSPTPYIIQNGKIYQLASNSQLVGRNLIHINQLMSADNNPGTSSGNTSLGSAQTTPIDENGAIISTGGAKQQIVKNLTTLQCASPNQPGLVSLNGSGGVSGGQRIIIKASDSSSQIGAQQQAIKSINIIPSLQVNSGQPKQVIIANGSNLNIKPTILTAAKPNATAIRPGTSPSTQKIILPINMINGAPKQAISISNTGQKLQTILAAPAGTHSNSQEPILLPVPTDKSEGGFISILSGNGCHEVKEDYMNGEHKNNDPDQFVQQKEPPPPPPPAPTTSTKVSNKQLLTSQFNHAINTIKNNINYNSKLIINSMQTNHYNSTITNSSKAQQQQQQQKETTVASPKPVEVKPKSPEKKTTPTTTTVVKGKAIKKNQSTSSLVSKEKETVQVPVGLNEKQLNEILLPDTRIFASLLNKDQHQSGSDAAMMTNTANGVKKQTDLNLKYKTTMIGNREHVILDNANNLSDFRGSFGELKNLACSVATHLNKPVTIPAFLVVDEESCIERIKSMLSEKNINPIVINTGDGGAKSESVKNEAKPEEVIVSQDSRVKLVMSSTAHQQHPHLVQTLNKKLVASPVPQQTSNNVIVMTNELLASKQTVVKKPRAPRARKASNVTSEPGMIKQPSQTCAEILSGAAAAAAAAAKMNNHSNVSEILSNVSKLKLQSPQIGNANIIINKGPIICEQASGTTTPTNQTNITILAPTNCQPLAAAQQSTAVRVQDMSSAQQKKPRIQKINEILMSNNTTSQNNATQILHLPTNTTDSPNSSASVFVQQRVANDYNSNQNGAAFAYIDQLVKQEVDNSGDTLINFFNDNQTGGGGQQVLGHTAEQETGISEPQQQQSMSHHHFDLFDSHHQHHDLIDIKPDIQDSHQQANFICQDMNGLFDLDHNGSHNSHHNQNGSHVGQNDFGFNFDPFDTNMLFNASLNDL